MKAVRWWMIGLLMLGAIINYLTRSTLAVAAPTVLKDLRDHHAAVLVDPRRLSGRDHAAADLRLRAGRGRPEDRASRCSRWPGRSSAWRTALAHSWTMLFWLRGLLGLRRRLGEPGRHEGDVGVVSGAGARPRRRRLQHRRVGRVDAGAAAGRLGHPLLQLAGGVRHHRGAGAGLGGAVALRSINRPRRHPALSADGTRLHPLRAGASPRRRTARGRRSRRIVRQRNFWGIALPRFLADPDVGHADVLAAALPDNGAALRSEADRAVRLAAVPGRRHRLPCRRHDQHGAAEALRHQPDQRAGAAPSPSAPA